VEFNLSHSEIFTFRNNFFVFIVVVFAAFIFIVENRGRILAEVYYVNRLINVKFSRFSVRAAAIVIVNPVS